MFVCPAAFYQIWNELSISHLECARSWPPSFCGPFPPRLDCRRRPHVAAGGTGAPSTPLAATPTSPTPSRTAAAPASTRTRSCWPEILPNWHLMNIFLQVLIHNSRKQKKDPAHTAHITLTGAIPEKRLWRNRRGGVYCPSLSLSHLGYFYILLLLYYAHVNCLPTFGQKTNKTDYCLDPEKCLC